MNTTACFHIGRGGRKHTPGYIEYLPECKSFRDCLEIAEKKGKIFIDKVDEDGNDLPDAQWRVHDCDNNTIVEGKDKITSCTGILDIDGIYDTYIARNVEECNPDELQAIIRDGVPSKYDDRTLFEHALDELQLVHVYGCEGPKAEDGKPVLSFKTSKGEYTCEFEDYAGMTVKEITDDIMYDGPEEFTMDSIRRMAEKIYDTCREFEHFSIEESEKKSMWIITDNITGVKLIFEEHNLNGNQDTVLPENISPEACSHSLMEIGEWLVKNHPELI